LERARFYNDDGAVVPQQQEYYNWRFHFAGEVREWLHQSTIDQLGNCKDFVLFLPPIAVLK
jgi:hypothetical protein